MKIATIGLWHLGTIYSVCLSAMGNEVFAITDIIDYGVRLEKGETDLFEPGLLDLLKKNKKTKFLKFTPNKSIVKNCDIVWITIDTSTNKNNLPNVSEILREIKDIIFKLKQGSIIVVSSQLPVGTCAKIEKLLLKNKRKKIGFAYVPENLRLGQSIDNFFHQDRVVIGTNDDMVFKKIKSVLQITSKLFIKVNPQTAEMIKHATNSFLATSLSFINDISDICEKVGADVYEISNALRVDRRIGPRAYLGAGLGFSGVTLERDLCALMDEAKKQKIELPVISAVQKKNELRKKYFFEKLDSHFKKIKDMKVGIWGITYKEGVSTLRGSLPIDLVRKILKLGAKVKIYGDITNKEKIIKEFSSGNLQVLNDQYKVLEDSNLLLLLSPITNKDINFSKMKKLMESPFTVFDCYNSFYGYEKEFEKNGLLYVGVGRYNK